MMFRRLRELILFFIVIISGLVVCGCAGTATLNTGNSSSAGEREREVDLDNVIMSDEEKKLLCSLYSDENRIQEGRLYDHQYENLIQIRFAKDYLNQKYDRSDFTFASYDAINRMDEVGSIHFHTDNSEELFELSIRKVNDSYACADNYYSSLIREEYDAALEKLIHERLGIEAEVLTFFPYLINDEFNGKYDAETAIALKEKLNRNTKIYVSKECGKNSEDFKETLKEAGLYGSYVIYFCDDMCENDINRLLELSETDYEKETFNCFDI